MKNIIKTLSLGLLLSAPFMQGMEGGKWKQSYLMGIPTDHLPTRNEVLFDTSSQLDVNQEPEEHTKSLVKLRSTCKSFNCLETHNPEEINIVKLLLERGASINSRNDNNRALLMAAQQQDNNDSTGDTAPGKKEAAEIIRMLLEHDTEPQ